MSDSLTGELVGKSLNPLGGAGILLWSLLLGGVNVHVAGRQPVVLYFDVVLAVWLVYQIYWKDFIPDLSGGIFWLCAVYVLFGLVSTLTNCYDAYKSLAALKVVGSGILVYSIARRIPLSLLNLALYGATVGCLLLLDIGTILSGGLQAESGIKDQVEISLGRSNYVASILLLLFPLAIAGIASTKGKVRLVFVACASLMLAGLVATMSRGAMAALLLAPALCLPLMFKAGLRPLHVAVALLLATTVVVLLPSDLLDANVVLIAERLENPDASRTEIMKASWQSFAENPVLGVGPGQLGRALATHLAVPESDQQYVNAHNLVLNALAENGLIAGLGLLGMIAMVVWRSFRIATAHPTPLDVALFVSILAAIIHNMVEASWEGQIFQVMFWSIAGIVDGRRRSLRKAIGRSL